MKLDSDTICLFIMQLDTVGATPWNHLVGQLKLPCQRNHCLLHPPHVLGQGGLNCPTR